MFDGDKIISNLYWCEECIFKIFLVVNIKGWIYNDWFLFLGI